MSVESTSKAGTPATPFVYSGRLTAAVSVSDLDQAKGWYSDVLGFEHIYTLDDWGWCEMRTPLGGVTLGIGQAESVHPEGGATLTFGVDDLDAARAWLERHDVRFDGDTREISGMVRLATFYDPDGNTFMLAQTLDGDPAGRT